MPGVLTQPINHQAVEKIAEKLRESKKYDIAYTVSSLSKRYSKRKECSQLYCEKPRLLRGETGDLMARLYLE